MPDLSNEQMDEIIALIENSIGDAVRNAVAAVVAGYTATPARRKGRRPTDPSMGDARLATTILATLAMAPERALTKTALRRQAGNGRPRFPAVLDGLVAEGKVVRRREVGASGRYVGWYELAPPSEKALDNPTQLP